MILVPSAGTMAAGVAEAAASNIELASGNGSVGGTDPKTLMSLDGGSTFQPASIINPHPSYNTIPGTSWVSDANGGSSRPTGTTIFQTTFDLPAGVQTPSITVRVHADNAATVLLNGTRIGAQREAEIFENFQDPAETYTAGGPFVAGTNVLRFVVRNFSGPMGLDYKAGVSYSIPASTDLGVVLDGVPDTWAVGSPPFPVSATVTNGGPDALGAGEASVTVGFPFGLSLAGPVPGGCSAVSGGVSCPVPALAVGASWTSPVLGLTAGRPTGSRTVTASVSTAAAGQDPDPDNNSDTDAVAVVVATDLGTTMSGVPSTIRMGQGFPVSSSVTNGGPSDLAAGEAAWSMSVSSGLIISGAAPPGCTQDSRTLTCPVAPLVAGGMSTMPEVTVYALSGGEQTVTVTARTADPSQDPDPVNNAVVGTVQVPITDLGVVVNGVPDTWAVGSPPFPVSATVTNGGPDALGAGEASVTVGFPSGLSLAGPVPGGCSAVSGGVSCPVPALDVGASWTSPAVELTGGRPTGSRTVTARVATVPFTQDQNDADNSDSDDVAIVIATDLSTTMSGVPSTIRMGQGFPVSSSVTNAGPSDLAAGEATAAMSISSGLTFSGQVPAGCTRDSSTLTCPVTALGASGVWTMPEVTLFAVGGGEQTVTATARTADPSQDAEPANDAAVGTVHVASTDLGVEVNGVPATWAVGSAPFPVSATVTNGGPDALGAGEASVTVAFPSGLSGLSLAGPVPGGCSAVSGGVSCPVPTLAAGASWTSPVLGLTAGRPAGSRTVTARVGTVPAIQDPDAADNVDSDDVAVVIATDLSTTMTGVPATTKETVPFTVSSSVRNSGPSDLAAGEATSTITIGPGLGFSGPTPAGCTATATTVTCPVPALVRGGSSTMPSVSVVGTSAGTSSTVTAAVVTAAAGQDPVPANDSDEHAVTVAPPPAPVATLSTTTLGFDPQRVGSSSASQSVEVTNTGDAPLNIDGVTVTGDFAADSGCSTGTTLAPGQSCTVRVTFTPTTTGSRPGTLTITHDGGSSPDVVSLVGVGQLHAEVSLGMDAGPAPVRTGRMTYRITVRNNGPDEATGLVLSDTLPAGTELVGIDPGSWTCTAPPPGQTGTVSCSLGSLASGATATVEVVVKVAARGTTPLSNTASVSTTSHDPDTTNNAATVVSSVGRP